MASLGGNQPSRLAAAQTATGQILVLPEVVRGETEQLHVRYGSERHESIEIVLKIAPMVGPLPHEQHLAVVLSE